MIHSISAPQAIFLTTVLRLESLKAEAGHPSTMLSYFRVEGINNSILGGVMEAIANQVSPSLFFDKCEADCILLSFQVNSRFIHHFSHQVISHSISPVVYQEVGLILLQCCDAYAQVRKVSLAYLNDLISSFPSLICESTVLSTLLELLTMLRRACQAELLDEVGFSICFSFFRLANSYLKLLSIHQFILSSLVD